MNLNVQCLKDARSIKNSPVDRTAGCRSTYNRQRDRIKCGEFFSLRVGSTSVRGIWQHFFQEKRLVIGRYTACTRSTWTIVSGHCNADVGSAGESKRKQKKELSSKTRPRGSLNLKVRDERSSSNSEGEEGPSRLRTARTVKVVAGERSVRAQGKLKKRATMTLRKHSIASCGDHETSTRKIKKRGMTKTINRGRTGLTAICRQVNSRKVGGRRFLKTWQTTRSRGRARGQKSNAFR